MKGSFPCLRGEILSFVLMLIQFIHLCPPCTSMNVDCGAETNYKDKNNTTPQYQLCGNSNSSTYPAADGTPLEGSKLSPRISGVEVYSERSMRLQETNPIDLQELEHLTSSFSKLQEWRGDPCLPNRTAWQWLRCDGDGPPRVTAIYLSGYGLEGVIPQFNLQALESLYMDNNTLIGDIPEFLGDLPNLKELNLACNNLSGEVPQSLRSNKNVKYNVTGNPLLISKEKKPLISVLWFLALLPLLPFVIYYSCFKKDSSNAGNKPVRPPALPVASPVPLPRTRIVPVNEMEMARIELQSMIGLNAE